MCCREKPNSTDTYQTNNISSDPKQTAWIAPGRRWCRQLKESLRKKRVSGAIKRKHATTWQMSLAEQLLLCLRRILKYPDVDEASSHRGPALDFPHRTADVLWTGTLCSRCSAWANSRYRQSINNYIILAIIKEFVKNFSDTNKIPYLL